MIQEANRHWQYTDTDSGLIMPWYTLPALEWLKKQDVSQWKVFEYGCGYSTIWWRLNCADVVSVDDNKTWAKAMGAELVQSEKIFYTTSIRDVHRAELKNTNNYYDCIVIDGEHRDDCTQMAMEALKPGGFLIVDNYEQPSVGYDYTKTNELLKGWDKVVYPQHNHSDWKTAIFTKP